MLCPSGEDANPLRRRLPAEVISRKRPLVRQPVEEKVSEDVRVELKAAVLLKPDARPKWLAKAFKMAEENRAPASELYAIITSRKFITGLPARVGRKIRDIVLENAGLFSERQQRHLRSEEWSLNAHYSERPEAGLDGLPVKDDADVDGEEPENKPAEDAARSKAREEIRGAEKERARAKAAEEGDTWTAVPAARGQADRVNREAAITEERAKRKERERDEQERWMEAQAEASKKKNQEQQDLKRRQQEDEVDNSLDMLLASGSLVPEPAASSSARESRKSSRVDETADRDRGRRRHGGLSRSRSVKARSRSRRRRRSRSRGRRGGSPKVDFAEALRRRLEQREASDTTRMAVVDPGHAARWASRGP